MIKIAMLGGTLALIVGCSKQDLYENLQVNHQFACNNVAYSQYDGCMERFSIPYEEYEAKRTEEPYEGGLNY
jgi:hypothetical protein